MAWRALTLTVSRRRAEDVGAALFSVGAAGVEERWLPGEAPRPRQPWDTGPPAPEPPRVVVVASFEDPDEPTLSEYALGLAAGDPHGGPPAWEDVPEVDWQAAFEASFQPIQVSPRIMVAPPWNAPDGAIRVEPGQGFGTGDHPTTRLALAALDRHLQAGDHALDVGCGSGVIAIAAVRLGANARGIDVDPIALRDSARNAALNAVDVPFDDTPLEAVTETYDVVVANVHAEVLRVLAPDLVRVTRRTLILGGILADREEVVRQAFAGQRLVERDQESDWVGLVYRVDG
jgi:ribosomal protein L11 methyltransferase